MHSRELPQEGDGREEGREGGREERRAYLECSRDRREARMHSRKLAQEGNSSVIWRVNADVNLHL